MGQVSITADAWSDQNRRPFLAMTAHWIAKVEGTSALQLKTALIAFHRLRGRHDGKTLAKTVLKLLDRAEITLKVRLLHEAVIAMLSDVFLKLGHFTLDNAGNNGTMMRHLARMLRRKRDINFDAVDRQIMCFAHVIDLSSGRVTRNADNTVCDDGVVDGDQSDSDYETDDETAGSEDGAVGSDGPIAHARNVVRVIRGSGMRRDMFNEVIVNGNNKGWFKKEQKVVRVKQLELLRDVRTRWDSVYLMLARLREMRPVWLYF